MRTRELLSAEERENRITVRDFLALTAAMYKVILPKLLLFFGVLVVIGLLLKWYLQ